MKYISQNVKLFLKIWQVLEGKLLPLKESVGMIFFFIHIKLPSLFFFFSCWIYMCFISSHPVHHRRSCTSCPSSLRLMNCTSSPSTSALRASPGMNAAERRPCDHAHAVSGIHLTLQTNKAYHCHLTTSTDFRAICFSALEDLHHVTTMRLLWWITSTKSGFLRYWLTIRFYSRVWPFIILRITKQTPSLVTAGHSSDGGTDSGHHPQQLSGERPPFGRWCARLCPPPDNWAGPWLPGEEPARTHHLQLLLRAHRQAGEACSGGERVGRDRRGFKLKHQNREQRNDMKMLWEQC